MKRHTRWEAMMSAYFAGSLPPADAAAVAAHARDCADCRRVYERYAMAERALEGDDRPLTLGAQDRIATRLLGASEPPRAAMTWSPKLAWAGAALALGAVFVFAPGIQDTDTLAPRGDDVAVSAGPTVRVLRVRATPTGGLQVTDVGNGVERATSGDYLRLLYSNLSGAKRVELSGELDGRALDVITASIALADGVQDQPLGVPIAVRADWRGKLVIRARFLGVEPPIERTLQVEVE